jgi:hypothetical protein
LKTEATHFLMLVSTRPLPNHLALRPRQQYSYTVIFKHLYMNLKAIFWMDKIVPTLPFRSELGSLSTIAGAQIIFLPRELTGKILFTQ